LDISKVAWRDGKKALFVGDDYRNKLLDIDPYDYIDADMGVTVSNNAKTKEIVERMKEMTQAFSQNGQSPKTILEILSAKSPSVLREMLLDVETAMKEAQAGQQESEQAMLQQQAQMQERLASLTHSLNMEKLNAEYDRKERLELIKGDIAITSSGTNENSDGQPDISAIESNAIAREKMYLDANAKAQTNATKIETERIKADTALKVAKQNKNKYDKPSK